MEQEEKNKSVNEKIREIEEMKGKMLEDLRRSEEKNQEITRKNLELEEQTKKSVEEQTLRIQEKEREYAEIVEKIRSQMETKEISF